MRVYRDIYNAGGAYLRTEAVFDIMEATYSGQDMGKRQITTTIKYPTPIDFQLGDYVVLSMQSLMRDSNHGAVGTEKFYIYTEPQCKKTARKYSTGDAFETTVTFYPRQYELSGIQMRDFVQQASNSDQIIYTGFDTVTFYGGARELLDRCMACLKQQYHDAQGNPLWTYVLADAVNEDKNNALERYAFSFQGNSVMDALMKLNDKDYINTTFFINDRTIYVGFKRPYLCSVNSLGDITDSPLRMMYGKTSHLPIDEDHGGLFDITKTVSEEVPITKLFAYGAARNLNRYYCSDRIKSGRYVNKLMLPSFSDDGVTDWIESEDGIKKYGIHEGSKNCEDIYPSLRYMTYADIRGIKYCIKVNGSGIETDLTVDGKLEHNNSASDYPVARVQCYKVTPCTGENGDGTLGVNKLVECAPPEDLAVFIHATGKTVKVLLCGGANATEAIEKQLAHDKYIPTTDGVTPSIGGDYSNVIPGSCFCVHDIGFAEADETVHYGDNDRASWFDGPFNRSAETDPIRSSDPKQQIAELHRIEYVDTFWLTDLYVMEYEGETPMYDGQKFFYRNGYSAWAWPRLNNQSIYPDTLPVNEILAVEPIVIADTSENASHGRQQHWDIYLRDIGFAIDEQNDFGEMVFVYSTPVVSMLDGVLAGREFTIDGGENLNDFQDRVLCAYKPDGTQNPDFFYPGDSNNESVPQQAFLNGAVWRIRLNRNDQDSELSSIGLVIPNIDIKAKTGDHMVLLDIYMPDIYIRAAESRLYREAKAFLEKNDKGNVKYAIDFDKVRFNQIPNYALQMREGVMLRMEDEDLNIKSENRIKKIVEYNNPVAVNVPLYKMTEKTITDEPVTRTVEYYMDSEEGEPKLYKTASCRYDRINYWNIKISKDALAKYKYAEDGRSGDLRGLTFYYRDVNHRNWVEINKNNLSDFELYDMTDYYSISFTCDNATIFGTYPMLENLAMKIEIDELASWSEYIKVWPDTGTTMPAICRDSVNFRAGKFYEVVVDVKAYKEYSQYGWRSEGTHIVDGHSENDDQILLTTSPTDIETRYKISNYTRSECIGYYVGMVERYKYSFYLPDEFDDDKNYYISLLYFSPSTAIDTAPIRLVSITEKDLDASGSTVNYVDFLASNVTIKIEDNTRPADIDGMGEDMRERVIPVAPEAIYDIQAQIEEQTKATTWATLRSDLEKTKIEADQIQRTQELIANAARQTYQNIFNLRNTIFDPDGNCNETFLQVMMLQVGADSMNYQLDKTKQSVTGVPSNYSVAGRESGTTNYDKFSVISDDTLRHYVYTQGAGNAGTWQIPGGYEKTLAPETVVIDGESVTRFPVYYICIRCKKDTVNDLTEQAWICSTKQYAVNDNDQSDPLSSSDYWYFNWGILTPDSAGHYTLQETRGNAYMYGDNIIAGKISDMAKNSYFDLTHGNFVLSDGSGSAALEYVDGILTIRGINNTDDPTSILSRLNLMDEIGGENLLYVTEHDKDYEFEWDGDPVLTELTYYSDDTTPRTHTLLPAGKYVFSANGVSYVARSSIYDMGVYLRAYNSFGSLSKSVSIPTGNVRNLLVELTEPCYIVLSVGANAQQQEQETEAYATLHNMCLQKGTKSTEFTNYVKHLTDALQGTTEIAGGLTMTNLLLLKNEQGAITAGMSGLTDSNPSGTSGDGTHSEGVAMFAGGSYADALNQAKGLLSQLQSLLPVLITKTGIGSCIGCFHVDSADQVSVVGADGVSKFIFNTGTANTGAYLSIQKNNTEIIRVTTDDIHPEKDSVEFGRYEYSTTSLNLADANESTSGKVVEIDTIDIAKTISYSLVQGNIIFVRLMGDLRYNAIQSQYSDHVTFSFDLYLGGKKLCTITRNDKPTTDSFDTVVAVTLPFELAYGSIRNIPSSMKLEIRNISITDADWPNTHPWLRLTFLSFGKMDQVSGSYDFDTWVDLPVRIYRSNIKAITVIGGNGFSTTGSDGVSVNLLRENGTLAFRTIGLPKEPTSNRQVIAKDYNMQRFKNILKVLLAEWDSATTQVKTDRINALYNAMPSTIKALSMQ